MCSSIQILIRRIFVLARALFAYSYILPHYAPLKDLLHVVDISCVLFCPSLLLDPKFPHKFRWCFVVSLSGRPLCLCPHPKPFTRRRRRRRDENIVVVVFVLSRARRTETKKAQQQHQRRDSFVVSNSRTCSASSSSSSSSSSKINRKSWLTSQS